MMASSTTRTKCRDCSKIGEEEGGGVVQVDPTGEVILFEKVVLEEVILEVQVQGDLVEGVVLEELVEVYLMWVV